MPKLAKEQATICIVNYKTLDLTRCCLDNIRKLTKYSHEVIVVDNNSQDQSLDYLRSVKDIRLIERKSNNSADGGYAHGAALDLGLENCGTEFFVSLHSDTFVLKEDWLTDLIRYFGDGDTIACVGAGKIELKPEWQMLLKKMTDFRTFKRKLLRIPDPIGKYRYYNRTICGLYRTDILRNEKLSFLMDRDKGLGVGKKLYFELVDRGYKTVELPSSVMRQYVVHIAHATQVTNPQEFNLRKRTVKKYRRLVNNIMSSEVFKSILEDNSLDK